MGCMISTGRLSLTVTLRLPVLKYKAVHFFPLSWSIPSCEHAGHPFLYPSLASSSSCSSLFSFSHSSSFSSSFSRCSSTSSWLCSCACTSPALSFFFLFRFVLWFSCWIDRGPVRLGTEGVSCMRSCTSFPHEIFLGLYWENSSQPREEDRIRAPYTHTHRASSYIHIDTFIRTHSFHLSRWHRKRSR